MYVVERRIGHIEGGRWAHLEKMASYGELEDAEKFAALQMPEDDWVETFSDDLHVVRIWTSPDALIRIYTTDEVNQ